MIPLPSHDMRCSEELGGRLPCRSGSAGRAAKSKMEWAFVLGCVVLGLLIRLDFMRASQWSIDSDEAIVGLMAKHILEGRGIPVFYYGQHYMGSLEALCASGMFRLFGASPIVLSLVPLSFALLLIPIMHALGAALGGRTAGRVAALLVAVPPSALIIWSTKARGGFIEVLVLGALALLVATKWLQGELSRLRYPTIAGAILGIGWWVNNQILYFLLPIGGFVGMAVLRSVLERKLRFWQGALACLCGAAAFFVGSLPYWAYNVAHGFPSLGMFGLADSEAVKKHAEGLFSEAIPILLGAVRFWHSEEIFPGAAACAYVLYASMLGSLLVLRRKQVLMLLSGCVDRKQPIEMVLAVIPLSCIIFVASTYGWLSQAPRYLLPMYVSLFVSVGFCVSALAARSRSLATGCIAGILGLNIASAYLGGRAIAGEPIVFNAERVARDDSELIAALDSLGIRYVRTNYWIGYRLAFETNERITFSMFQEPHQVRIPEYEAALAPAARERTPLVLVPGEAELVRGALRAAQVPFSERAVAGYVIMYDLQPPAKSAARQVFPEVQSAKASGSRDPYQALDGDVRTRWGSGEAQKPGMSFEVMFEKPERLSGIEYEIGMWPHDYPRGLQVELVLPSGERRVALRAGDYEAVRYLYQMNGVFRLDFAPQEVRGVVLIQTGRDERLDWSIGELMFLGPGGQG